MSEPERKVAVVIQVTQEQLDALSILEGNTHDFWNPDAARNLTQPFGFNCVCHVEYANPRDPKGLAFNDGAASGTGASSVDVSEQIVRHLHLEAPSFMGRGFQVRGNVQAVLGYLRSQLPKGKTIAIRDGGYQLVDEPVSVDL